MLPITLSRGVDAMNVDMQALYNEITKVRPEYTNMSDEDILKLYESNPEGEAMWELMLERERRNI